MTLDKARKTALVVIPILFVFLASAMTSYYALSANVVPMLVWAAIDVVWIVVAWASLGKRLG